MTDFQSVIDTWCSERTCSTWRGRRRVPRGRDVELRKHHLDVLLLPGITEDPFDPLCFAMRSAYRVRRCLLGWTDGNPRYDKENIIVTGSPEFEYSHTPQDTDHFTSVRWLPDALCVTAGLCESIRDSYPNFFRQGPGAADRSHQLRSLFGKFLRTLLSRESYSDYIAYSKWWSTWYLAKFLDQELPVPPRPTDRLPFEGDLRRFFRMRLLDAQKGRASRRRRRAWRFFNTVQQIKRCTNPVPETFIADCLGKHMKTMGQPKLTHLMEDIELDEQEDVVRTVADEVTSFRLDLQDFRAKARQVLSRFRAPPPRLMSASTSAGFDISRDSGGQQAEIYYKLGGVGPMRVQWIHQPTICCEVGDECRLYGIGRILHKQASILPSELMQIIGLYSHGDEDNWELIPPSADDEKTRSKICGCLRGQIYKKSNGEGGFIGASFEVPDDIVRMDDLVAMYYRPLDGVWEVRGLPLPRIVQVSDMILTGQYRSDEFDIKGGLTGYWTCRRPRSRFVPFKSPSKQNELERQEYYNSTAWRWVKYKGDCDGNRPLIRNGLGQGDLNPIRRHDDLGPEDWFPNCLRARIVPVSEPWKVRTISAGESMPYWFCRYFQKAIHDYMRCIPQFQFIGQSLTSHSLTTFFRRAGFVPPVGTKMVSGDYSGATDGVSITLTEICHEEAAFSVRDPVARMILDRVIGSHRCHYDGLSVTRPNNMDEMIDRDTCPYDFELKGGRDVPPPVLQNNGQLMGSVLSFPYLCLINFVGTWQTVFPHIERFEDVPILVNGDDIFFFTDDVGYRRWNLGLDFMGFTKSLGKNFFHHDYGYMNSVPFQYDWKLNQFETFPFYNVGLLYGRQRVSNGTVKFGQQAELADGEPLGSVPLHMLQPKAVEGASNLARAAARFAKIHKKYLQRVSKCGGRVLNYYVPVEFGGLGMTLPDRHFVQNDGDPDVPTWGFSTQVTPWQAGLWRKSVRYYSQPFLDVPPFPRIVGTASNVSQYTVKRWRIGRFGPAPMVCKSDEIHQPTVLRVLKCTPIDQEVCWTRKFLKFFGKVELSSVNKKFRDQVLRSSVVLSDIIHGRGLLPSLIAMIRNGHGPRRQSQPAVAGPVAPPQLPLDHTPSGDRIIDAEVVQVDGEERHIVRNANGWFAGWHVGDLPRPVEDDVDIVVDDDDHLDEFTRYEDAAQSML